MSDFYVRNPKTGEIRKESDAREWGKAFEATDRKIERTIVMEGVEVSTVFLGLDHAFGGGRPLIFESLVFGGKMDQHMDRYTTEAEARKGHAAIVASVQAAELVGAAVVKATDSMGALSELPGSDEGNHEGHLRTLATGDADDEQE